MNTKQKLCTYLIIAMLDKVKKVNRKELPNTYQSLKLHLVKKIIRACLAHAANI